MGISKELYDKLRESFGMYSSWAIWADAEENRPKSNIGDMSVFNDPNLLEKLNDKFIFVGLNAAEHSDKDSSLYRPWKAFHSTDDQKQQDFKLRFALKNTQYWGSYMTDILKGYEKTDSKEVEDYLRKLEEKNPDGIYNDTYIGGFIKELESYETAPTLIAMGGVVERILYKYFSNFKIVKIRHYSDYRLNKEDYRQEVLTLLKNV